MSILFTAGVLAVIMASMYAAGRFLTGRRMRSVLLYAALGVGSLWALHALGANVGLNMFTVLISAVLGMPGTALIWLIGWIG